MKFYFEEKHEELFQLHTYNSLDGMVGGKEYINTSGTLASSRIQYSLSYNKINPYYCDFTVIKFVECLQDFLFSENLNLYVMKKTKLSPVNDWIRQCSPFIDMNSRQLFKFKMKVL